MILNRPPHSSFHQISFLWMQFKDVNFTPTLCPYGCINQCKNTMNCSQLKAKSISTPYFASKKLWSTWNKIIELTEPSYVIKSYQRDYTRLTTRTLPNQIHVDGQKFSPQIGTGVQYDITQNVWMYTVALCNCTGLSS